MKVKRSFLVELLKAHGKKTADKWSLATLQKRADSAKDWYDEDAEIDEEAFDKDEFFAFDDAVSSDEKIEVVDDSEKKKLGRKPKASDNGKPAKKEEEAEPEEEVALTIVAAEREEVPIKKLKAAKYNPANRVTERNVKKLVESIKRVGLLYPILVDKDYNIIEGHRRTKAYQMLEQETIPAMVIDADDKDAVYSEVNSTSKKMGGNDALGVWLKCPNASAKSQAKSFENAQEIIGKNRMKKIFKQSLTLRVWSTAKRLANHCDYDEPVEFLDWLLEHGNIGQVMKALDRQEDPRVFMQALKKNKPVKFALEVG